MSNISCRASHVINACAYTKKCMHYTTATYMYMYMHRVHQGMHMHTRYMHVQCICDNTCFCWLLFPTPLLVVLPACIYIYMYMCKKHSIVQMPAYSTCMCLACTYFGQVVEDIFLMLLKFLVLPLKFLATSNSLLLCSLSLMKSPLHVT